MVLSAGPQQRFTLQRMPSLERTSTEPGRCVVRIDVIVQDVTDVQTSKETMKIQSDILETMTAGRTINLVEG